MRKLKLQVQVSIDGFIAGPNGEMDWMVWNWDDKLKDYVTGLIKDTDCIVLGRKLAEGFIPYWAANPEQEGAEFMNDTHKVVFSKTLEKHDWQNTELANGDLKEEILQLKQQPGRDIIAYGGAGFVSALIKEGLIDEYHLFINPTAIGSGLPIFKELNSMLQLKLLQTTGFECGVVVLSYTSA
ncbi:dihydrofolate reductase [Flavobacterium sp. Sd200]|uniref:dihydrofolate reductase family protein n=1 Tax=Flavobacterium sp. Sd200 TaxID=2692211 RepID=UPI00136E2C83|nr:dihydrofolate reductase family protein [Flavobacterium sp. Sd200]MXN92882.1 dihydrofolate reductase [Flavobacterium sp. Sd200]